MKRQISTLASMLLLIALVFTFASCDAVNGLFGGSDEHQHTYSEDWSSDETNHWHAATCENGDECKTAVNAQAAHAFGADGKCTVCAYEKPAAPHEHNFVDGKCECGATDPSYVAPHEHTYADTLTAGETTHWYAATCEAGDECATAKKDEAAHDFANGDCVCGAKAPVVEPDGTMANPFAITVPGTLDVNFAGGYDPIWYVFTATETKTLSVTLGSNNACMAYGVNVNDVVYTAANQTNVKVNLTAGTTYYVAFCSHNGDAAEYTVTAEYVVSPYERVLHAGNNTVVFSAAEVEANAASRKLVIDEAASYKFASGNLFVASVVDANGAAIAKNDDYTYTLAAGEYTVNFGMLSMFGVVADADCTLNVENPNAEDDDEGDVTGESDFVIGENSVTLTDEEANNGKNFTFVAQSAGTYTFSGLLAIVSDSNGMQIGRMEVFLEAGTYTVTLVNIEGVGGDFTLTIAYTAPAGSGDGEGGEGDGSTEDNPTAITLPAEDLAANGDAISFNWYIFTTTEAGTITITYSNNNGWARIYNVDDAEDSNTAGEKQVMTFAVKADSTYKLGLGVWNEEAGATASVTFTAGEAGGDEGGEEGGLDVEPAGSLEADVANTVTVSDADKAAGKVYYSFYPWNSGEYAFESNDLWVTAVYLNGTALETNDNGYYVLEEMTSYIVEISVAYVYAGDYTITPAFQYPYGAIQNPEYFDWEYEFGTPFTATYAGGYTPYWYSFYATADGVLTVTTENTNAVIAITAVPGMDIVNSGDEGEWLGSISMPVIKGRQYYIGVMTADSSAAEIVFTPTVTEGEYVGEGTENAPIIMVNGANTANVPQWGLVWFAYKAPANGTLTVTTANEFCAWYFKGVEEFASAGDKSIWVEEGKIVYLSVETSDWEAHDIEFTASFKKDPTEVYSGNVVADGTANSITVEDQTWVIVDFMGGGQYQITWDNAAAKVELAEWGGNTVLANGDVITGSNWGTNLMIYFEGYAAGTVNVTITPYVEESSSNSLVIGDNTIEVQDTSMGDTYALPVADETVTYVLTVGANGVLILSDGTVLTAEGSTTEITVPAGETVTVGIGALSWSNNVAAISVAIKEASTPDEGGDEPGTSTEGTGTAADPIIITELPYTVSFEGNHDKYLKYTVTEDCTIVITYTAGYVSGLPSNFEKNASTKSYTGEVKAGDVLNINPWGSVNATYTIAVAPADEGGEDEGEGGDTVVAEPVASVTIAAPGNFKGSGWKDFYTVTTSGNYVITAENYDSIQKTYIQVKVNGGDTILVAKGAELENCMPYTIALNAGDVVTVQLYGWNDADKGIEVTINLSPAA